MTSHHTAVWIDHHEAKVFHVDDVDPHAQVLRAPAHHVHRHSTTTAERQHPADAAHFYHEVAKALRDADEILVLGPATAKLELVKHIHAHDHALAPKIIGVETVDHPTDGELLKYVRGYFKAADRMH